VSERPKCTTATLVEAEPTQHNTSEQTPDKEVKISSLLTEGDLTYPKCTTFLLLTYCALGVPGTVRLKEMLYSMHVGRPGILFGRGGGVRNIQLGTEEKGDGGLGAKAPW